MRYGGTPDCSPVLPQSHQSAGDDMTSGVAVMVRLRRNVIEKFRGRTFREVIINGMDCDMPFSVRQESKNVHYVGSVWSSGKRTFFPNEWLNLLNRNNPPPHHARNTIPWSMPVITEASKVSEKM